MTPPPQGAATTEPATDALTRSRRRARRAVPRVTDAAAVPLPPATPASLARRFAALAYELLLLAAVMSHHRLRRAAAGHAGAGGQG